MKRAVERRRRAALVVLACLALAAFTFGATLGDGAGPPQPGVAETLLAGERIVVGVSGTSISPGLRGAIHEGRVAGVVLFAGNFPSRAAGRRLIAQLQAIPRPPKLRGPLLVMVDQEGGQVKRLSGAPTASAREMGARGAAFSAGQGRRAAANLRDVGVNVDLAPVLDVGRPGGVIAETENTDFSVERIDLSRRELRSVDEKPYAAFVAAGGKLVMLSTAIYPAFSDDPAAFTRSIVTGELRNRLGFEGVTITDALETPAVDHFGSTAKSAVAGARAGADLLLYAHLGSAETAWRALLAKLRSGALGRDEFEAAVERVLDLRDELPR